MVLSALVLSALQVVYLPSCVTRMMGPCASDYETASVHDKLMSLFGKAGYEVSFCAALRAC
jgi:D-lactate dehydrogenase